MEYVYAAMLLHSAKKDISEKAVEEVLKAAGVTPDAARAKALVASLKEVNIEEAIKAASVAPVAVAAAPVAQAGGNAAKEEKSEEDTAKSEEAAAEGLSALFG
ncbi:MAG: 50S ribosomal protein P1 [Candidatus Diapherotrites archaeon]|uniref:Large ribosomal subunit protein P1 n=1 Tax=Candidatus Iainarchaeum sp. TaxID=3101447 RepID=A0A8T4L631_9ARCH|nr:50S ribosomal protein P1 [Candidatus Diapherotrites archaeon]